MLRRVTNEEIAGSVRDNYHDAPIDDAEKAMLDYSVKLTRDPRSMSRDDVGVLRDNGFDDQAIAQITLIASWFNYINRVADSLGIGRGDG